MKSPPSSPYPLPNNHTHTLNHRNHQNATPQKNQTRHRHRTLPRAPTAQTPHVRPVPPTYTHSPPTTSTNPFRRTHNPQQQQQQTSPLLRLPGELRNAIYTLALTPPPPLCISPSRKNPYHTTPALRLVCKQIAHETSFLFHHHHHPSDTHGYRSETLRLHPSLHPPHLHRLSPTLTSLTIRRVELPLELIRPIALDYTIFEAVGVERGWVCGFRGKTWVGRVGEVVVWREKGEGWDEGTRGWVEGVVREVFCGVGEVGFREGVW